MKADRIIDDLRLRLLKVKDRGGERVGLGLSPHAPYTVSKRLFEEVARTARQRKLPIMVHLSETADEEAFVREGTGLFADIFKKAAGWGDVSWNGLGLSAAMYLDSCGILAEKTIATHAVHMSEEDIRVLRARDVSVAHCPRSNAFLGVGRAPVKAFLDEGVLVGLGTDSLASNDRIDFFDEMRALDPSIPLDLRIRMATINGARALGLGDKIGSIEVGKYADLIAVTVLSDNPYDVCLATKEDIRLVMVKGCVLHET
jgi:5-methylthioadenosine/S-adenosylhomocysteine deaminase